MGTTASKSTEQTPVESFPTTINTATAVPQQRQQQEQKTVADEPSACPLGFDKKAADKKKNESSNSSNSGGSACPVKEEDRGQYSKKYMHPHKYNVYSQRIDAPACADPTSLGDTLALDPSNNMPANPNQQRAPGQEEPLSTERVKSTIPKGGEEATWTYPSPQMFWNALSRKDKTEGSTEGDMDAVVSIHNNMNENTWRKILQWEQIRKRGVEEEGEEGSDPRLLKFLGRPDEVAPKAVAKMMAGHPLPFDRHDWVVDRGGDERRYVIDYYHDEGGEDADEMPELHSREAVKSIQVDVRPALDEPRDFFDRLVHMPLARLTGKSDFVPLPFLPSSTMKPRETWGIRSLQESWKREGDSITTNAPTASGSSSSSNSSGGPLLQHERDARAIARMKNKCVKPMLALRSAEESGDEAQAEAAALKLEYCTARYLCKKEARAYMEAVDYVCSGSGGGATAAGPEHSDWAEGVVETRLSSMRAALQKFTDRQLMESHHEGEDDEQQQQQQEL